MAYQVGQNGQNTVTIVFKQATKYVTLVCI